MQKQLKQRDVITIILILLIMVSTIVYLGVKHNAPNMEKPNKITTENNLEPQKPENTLKLLSENKFLNFSTYENFKTKVNKKENAILYYEYSTIEGDPITITIKYDKNSGFNYKQDNTKDEWAAEKEITEKNFKYLYEIKTQNEEIMVYLSNFATEKETLLSSSNEVTQIFTYRK